MAFFAGEIVTATRLNRLQPVSYGVAASGALTLTTTVTDVPGATITLNTLTANAVYKAWAVFDMVVVTAATGNNMNGYLSVDGAQQTAVAAHEMVAADLDTVAQQWRGTLATAGSHTLKLRGNRSAAGDGTIAAAHTTLIVEISEVV